MADKSSLELRKHDFFPKLFGNEALSIQQLSATSHRFASFLWEAINANEDEDRSGWSGAQWQNYLTDPRCEFYAIYCDLEPAGCCELIRMPRLMRGGGSVRIKAFGLLPEFAGDGLGSSALTRLVEKSLATGADRVILRTGQQLPKEVQAMFRNQGFRVFTTE